MKLKALDIALLFVILLVMAGVFINALVGG